MASSSAAVAPLLGAMTLDQELPQLQQLPRVLLQCIPSLLDPDQDLYSFLQASTVSRKCRAAAAAALTRISLKHVHGRSLGHLYSYLCHQGGLHLTSLTLSSKPDDLMNCGRYDSYCYMTQLPPLPSLQQLSLAGFILQLGPVDSSSEPGVLAAAAAAAGTRLTLLSIDKCRLLDGPGGLDAVSALRSLRHLHLGWASLVFRSPNDTAKDDNYTFPGRLLSVLVQLTHLSLGLAVDTPSLQHLSCLTGLQELLIPEFVYCSFQLSDLAALQHAQQLTKVVLGMPNGAELSASTLHPTSGLHPLRAVKHLALEVQAAFDPALLASLPQLQHLQYTEGIICSIVGAGLTGGAQSLLGQLALHTQLTFLQLDCELHGGPELPAVSAFSAITASSQLQHLVLRTGAPYGAEPPDTRLQSIWPHVFPEQLQLPHLHHLTLSSRALRLLSQPTVAATASSADSNEAPSWQDQCLARLAHCCPHLESLDVLKALQGRLSLTPLLQLPRLTSLAVHHISDAEAQAVVAQMRGLVRLEVGCHAVPGCISAASLARLTALQLTYLSLTGNDRSAADEDEDEADIWDPDEAAEMHAYAPFRVADATLAVVARLSSLQELQLHKHPSLTDVGLLQLSALRQLTHLDVRDAYVLLGFNMTGSWVSLPTQNWRRGLTLGQPVWPELLERVLRSHDPSARQQAQQAVLANRQELLGVLGPGLAAALPRMRFHRSYEELDDEVEKCRDFGGLCSWGSGSGWLSSAGSAGSSDSESGEGPGQGPPTLCEPQECTAQGEPSPWEGAMLPGATAAIATAVVPAAGNPAGAEADNSDKEADSSSGSSSSSSAAGAAGAAATQSSELLSLSDLHAGWEQVAMPTYEQTQALMAAVVQPTAAELASATAAAAAAAMAAGPVGIWQLPGGFMPVGSAAAAAAVPDSNAELGAAADTAEGAQGADVAAGGTSDGAADEGITTAATAMRERLSFVVRLLATRGGPSG